MKIIFRVLSKFINPDESFYSKKSWLRTTMNKWWINRLRNSINYFRMTEEYVEGLPMAPFKYVNQYAPRDVQTTQAEWVEKHILTEHKRSRTPKFVRFYRRVLQDRELVRFRKAYRNTISAATLRGTLDKRESMK